VRGRREQAKRASLLDGLVAPSFPRRDRRAPHGRYAWYGPTVRNAT